MAFISNNPNHLLIGLGGTGGKVLKEFKKRLYLEYPDDSVRNSMKPSISFLYVDSTREMMDDEHNDATWKVMGRRVAFQPNEFFCIRPQGNGISDILDKIDTYPGLKYMVKNANSMRTTLGEIKTAAGQKRRAGRLMFASNSGLFLQALGNKYAELRQRTKVDSLHVHIFTGLAGGTGSGSIVDVIAQTRLKYPSATIDVYAMVPEHDIPQGFQAGRYHQNGYAALKELSALSCGQFLPSDVVSGEEHVDFNTDALKQFGLILYSNVNDNDIAINSTTELPKLIADAVYFRLFLPDTQQTNQFLRAWSCENLDDNQVEFATNTKENDKKRARTKAIASLGIKRIVYPERRLIEHISRNSSVRIMWQMLYNNYKEDGEGYVNEPERKDYKEFTKNPGNLRNWKLDDKHLTLEEKILETDNRGKQYESFADYWESTTTFYNYNDAKEIDDNPLVSLYNYCEDQWKTSFRLHQGVEDFFKDKTSESTLREQAGAILDAIEQHLFTQWLNGTYSMYDLNGTCEAILDYISTQISKKDEEIVNCDEKIEELHTEYVDFKEDYDGMNILVRKIKGQSNYGNCQSVLKDLYLWKTKKESIRFKGTLLLRLKEDFLDFQQQINGFIGRLSKAQELLIKEVTARTRETNKIDSSGSYIEVSEDSKMVRFEKRLLRNRSQIDSLASLMRKKLVNEHSFMHFGDLSKVLANNPTIVADIADSILEPQIQSYHDQDEECRRDRIVGLNVLQQMQKLFAENGDMNLESFANDVINHCGVYIKLNLGELSKALRNNPNPTAKPESMDNHQIIIAMPKPEGDETLKAFSEDFKDKLRSAVGAGGAVVSIYDESPRKNEITIMEVRSCFPVRALSWLPDYKKEYDKMVNNPNPAEAKEAKIILHSEGDGTELPLLEGEGEGPKGTNLIPYFFLSAAIGAIVHGQNEREESGWCYQIEDEWGIPSLKLLASDFTEILNSEELTPEIKESIIEKVDNFVKNPDLKMSERASVCDKIKQMMREVIIKECTNTTSPKFQEYGNMAKVAIKMIEK